MKKSLPIIAATIAIAGLALAGGRYNYHSSERPAFISGSRLAITHASVASNTPLAVPGNADRPYALISMTAHILGAPTGIVGIGVSTADGDVLWATNTTPIISAVPLDIAFTAAQCDGLWIEPLTDSFYLTNSTGSTLTNIVIRFGQTP